MCVLLLQFRFATALLIWRSYNAAVMRASATKFRAPHRPCALPKAAQAKAYVERLIHALLVGVGYLAGALAQAVLIQRAYLLQ